MMGGNPFILHTYQSSDPETILIPAKAAPWPQPAHLIASGRTGLWFPPLMGQQHTHVSILVLPVASLPERNYGLGKGKNSLSLVLHTLAWDWRNPRGPPFSLRTVPF